MKEQDFLINFSNLDDELIAEAEDSYNNFTPKKNNWIKWVVIAACCTIIVGVFIALSSRNSDVIYADSADFTVFMSSPGGKVEYMNDFSKYKDNDKLRVMIMIYSLDEGYPNSYNELINGKTVDELFQEFKEKDPRYKDGQIQPYWLDEQIKWKIVDDERTMKELKWLKSIGATDIIQNLHGLKYFYVTIKAKDITKIETGKCKYKVLLATKDNKQNNTVNIDDLYGEYKFKDVSFVSSFSSSIINKDMIANKKMLIGKDFIDFSIKLNLDNVSYEIDNQIDNVENYFGFSEIDFENIGSDLLATLCNDHLIINVYGPAGSKYSRIIFDKNFLYLDMGMRGTYKFEKVADYDEATFSSHQVSNLSPLRDVMIRNGNYLEKRDYYNTYLNAEYDYKISREEWIEACKNNIVPFSMSDEEFNKLNVDEKLYAMTIPLEVIEEMDSSYLLKVVKEFVNVPLVQRFVYSSNEEFFYHLINKCVAADELLFRRDALEIIKNDYNTLRKYYESNAGEQEKVVLESILSYEKCYMDYYENIMNYDTYYIESGLCNLHNVYE